MSSQQSGRHTAPPFPDLVSFPHDGARDLRGVDEALWASCLRNALYQVVIVLKRLKLSLNVPAQGLLSWTKSLLGGRLDRCFTMRGMQTRAI